MLLYAKIVFTLLLFASSFEVISCTCRQSYMTICDTFDDFKNYDTENVHELIIGSESKDATMTTINLMEMLKLERYQFATLIIHHSINNLEMTYHYECLYARSPLKYFSLYGNELKHIRRYQFPLVPLKKFSLVNNKIETIKSEALMYVDAEDFDLSDNLLETIEFRALPTTRAAKIFKIRNNRLTHIEPESFPKSLQSLHLDNNNLRYVQEKVFNNLVNLRELTLSHNKFNELPDVSALTKLEVFDISYNEIRVVEKWTFKKMDNLKLIDLSNNIIASHYILHWLDVPEKQPSLTISVAMNRLRDLDLTNLPLQNKTLILYGNPWNCSRWNDLKTRLSSHESKCDLEYLSSEESPYCISYMSGVYPFKGMWEQDIDRFHVTVGKNKKVKDCTLALKKYHILNPVDFFCVFVKDDVD